MRIQGISRTWAIALMVAAAFVLVVVLLWLRQEPAEQPPAAEPISRSEPAPPQQRQAASEPADQPPAKGQEAATRASTGPATEPQEATAAYNHSLELLARDRLLEARSEMCGAYFSGRLPQRLQDEARRKLTDLAEATLIGPRSTVYAGDPYAFWYSPLPGQALATIERQLKLHVPWQAIVRINGLTRPENLEAGRQYKMVYGPFHAVVHKRDFTMDVYLHREGLERVYIKRLAIGTGSNGSTPAGMWRVKLGGKQERPTWYPPPNSRFRGPVPYGQANYAFGAKGLWIGLEGTDEQTLPLSNYGLHSTNDPTSIGKAQSLGCIRLADDDIELLYSLLYEYWSTVEVRP